MWYVYIMENHSIIKNEIMKATAKWLKLKRINLGGGNSDSERQTMYS